MWRGLIGVALLGMLLGWLVMPSHETGPALSADDGVSTARGAAAEPAQVAVTRTPDVGDHEDGERPAAMDRTRIVVPPPVDAAPGSEPTNVEHTKEQTRMMMRTERVASEFYDVALRARHTTDMDDSTYRAVVKRLEQSDRELSEVRAAVDAGGMDADDAAARIDTIQQATLDDMADYGDEKAYAALEHGISKAVDQVKGIEAWEGIPIEEWGMDEGWE
jgi:hypothetical protein